jgi:NAD(P)-dependent dehydrogenase (short-subunit alcohol dehydrogenase family)
MELKGSVVVVTGASSGIGLATARSFAAAGTKVILAARSQAKLEALAEELRAKGLEAFAVPTDVRERAQVDHLIESAYGRYGRLDILVNNAGRGTAAYVVNTPLAHYRELFELNVFGPLNAMQAVIPQMRGHGGGLIINVSSGAGRRHIPGLSAYGASKAALDLISNTVREELARENIRVMTVYPPNTESEAAKNMLGDLQVAMALLMESISKVVKRERMLPVPAEIVAQKIVEAARKEPPDTNLFLDAEMYIERTVEGRAGA